MDPQNPELGAFGECGYHVVRALLRADEIAALREACDTPGVRPERLRRGGAQKLLHLLEASARHPRFLELARDRRLIDVVAEFLGPNLELQHSKIATKPETDTGRGAAPWHQDFPFFPHTNTDLVAAMVMLDDADERGGCLQVLPGSRRLGPLDHRRDGFFSGECAELPDEAMRGGAVALPVRAGDVTLHHCLTLHRSAENTSGSPRRALVFQFRAADAYQLAGEVWVDTGLVVRGRAQTRVRCEANEIALPRRHGVDFPYGSAWHQHGGYARAHNFRVEHLDEGGSQ